MSETLLEVLKFYVENGSDLPLVDEITPSQGGNEQINNRVNDQAVEAKEENVVIQAQNLAAACEDLASLEQAVRAFSGCEIKKTATNTVFSDGNPNSEVMLVGEAPGATEDLEGRPFCGASGQLLDKMFAAIGLDRSKIYITNTVFWRPPGNRRPTDLEIETCRPFVEKHIALIQPKILVLVGGTACYSLLDRQNTISKIRGRFHTYTNQFLGRPITVSAIFHPAYLMRQPMQKKLAWQDLQQIKEYLDKECLDKEK